MITVFAQSNWKIAVYGREHGVPHFHIEGPNYRCSVAIEDGGMIIGHAPKPVYVTAWLWAQGNKEMLLAKWKELNG